MNTLHLEDMAGAMWAAAQWIEPLGRAKADELAGETITYFPPGKPELVAGLEGYLPKGQDPRAPFFNVVSRYFT